MSTKLAVYESQMTSWQPSLADLLPSSLSPSKFQAAFINAIRADNNILEATPQSLQEAIFQSAKMGLLIDRKEAYIVVYKDNKNNRTNVTFIPMIAGIKKLMLKAGFMFDAAAVYEGDHYLKTVKDGEVNFEHVALDPDLRAGKKIRFYYAYAKQMSDGRLFHADMSMEEIAKRKAISKTDKVWGSFFHEMCCKTVIHTLSKKLPLDQETIEFLSRDMEEMVDFDKIKDITPKAPLLDRMKAKINVPAVEVSSEAIKKSTPKEIAVSAMQKLGFAFTKDKDHNNAAVDGYIAAHNGEGLTDHTDKSKPFQDGMEFYFEKKQGE